MPMGWTWFRQRVSKRTRVAVYILFGVYLLAGVYLIDCAFARHRLSAYRETLRQQGEKLTLEELLPAPSKEARLAGVRLYSASSLLKIASNTPTLWWECLSNNHAFCFSKLPGEILFSPAAGALRYSRWRSYEYGIATNGWQAFAREMLKQSNAIENIEMALNSPQIALPSRAEVETNWPTTDPQLSRALGMICNMELLQLHQGETAKAHRSLMAAMKLLRLRLERPDILTRSQLRTVYCSAWDYLQYSTWTDSQLSELQTQWEGLDFCRSFERKIRLFRANLPLDIEYARHHWPIDDYDSPGKAFWSVFEDGDPSFWYDRFPYYWNWILRRSYEDERREMECGQIWIEASSAICAGRAAVPILANANEQFDALYTDKTRHLYFFSASYGDPRVSLRQSVADEAMKRIMIASIALKRFQLKTGSYPASLTELSPQYLASIPLDPMTAAPLKYRVDPVDGYQLYSVGADGTDEGGASMFNPFMLSPSSLDSAYYQPTGTDWVWPHPATAQEVEAALTILKTPKYNPRRRRVSAPIGTPSPTADAPAITGSNIVTPETVTTNNPPDQYYDKHPRRGRKGF